MKKATILYTILIFICLSCSSKEKPNDSEHSESKTYGNSAYISNNKKNKTNYLLVDTVKLYKDEFILSAIETDVTLPNLLGIYNNVIPQYQYIPNALQSSLTDTLVKIISNNDMILFHKGGGNTILEKMNIESQQITIDNNIHIGVTKQFLEQKFNTSQLPNIFIVQDTEGGNIFTFYIINNLLVKMSFSVVYF